MCIRDSATNEGYVNAHGDWPTARVNLPIIRFAEMMLFRAEAYLMKNQPDKAWKDLNRIHVRACGPVSYTHLDVYKRQSPYHLFSLWIAPSAGRYQTLSSGGRCAPAGERRYHHV